MTDLVDSSTIESIVGVLRHPYPSLETAYAPLSSDTHKAKVFWVVLES